MRTAYNTRLKAMAAQRNAKILKAFYAGAEYQQIAEEFNISPQRASNIIRAQLAIVPQEGREEVRAKIAGGLRYVLRRATKLSQSQDGREAAQGCALLLKCHDQLARLYGAYAPEVKAIDIAETAADGAVVHHPKIVFAELTESAEPRETAAKVVEVETCGVD